MSLRPGPAITGPVRSVHDGTGILARRWGRWIWPAEEDDQSVPAALRRLAGTGGVATLGAIVVQDSPGLMWLATGGWCAAAWHAARKAGATEEPEEATAAALSPREFTELVRAAIPPGSPGVHLAELVDLLDAEAPRDPPWDTSAVPALATAAGLPVVSTRSHTRPGSASTGIRAKDLPPPPGAERGPVAVVAAGQRDDNDNDTASDSATALIISDPTDPSGTRHIVKRRAA
ncbi:hypothetical protein [Streptomyces sp. SBT349]|uniref:hypothetical protein n=1 Tax=Streptomyces sp. SBT349 TaxID=1580539 RepID=UPI00066A4263|nr:hypothetical protein [Streptomyces sp. SBT349]